MRGSLTTASRQMSRLSEILDSLPLGRTPVVMFLLLAVSAATLTLARREGGQTLTYWTFERVHYEDYEEAKVDFEAAHPGWRVEVKLLSFSSLMNRLTAAFVRGYGAPDMVDIEITSVNRFFKGDPAEVPFEDLSELAVRLGDEPWLDRVVAARLAPYSYGGKVFGMPQDLCPVVLLYRQDLLESLGYPELPAVVETWEDMVQVAREVSRSREADPENPRYGIALRLSAGWEFIQLLLQNDGALYTSGDDGRRRFAINRPAGRQVLEFYSDMFNKHRVAYPIRDTASFWGAVKRDEILTFLATDWFLRFLSQNVPEQAGKWRAMPMPVWREGGRRTSTLGGTTNLIPKQAKNKEMAWEFAKYLFLNPELAVQDVLKTRMVPALHEAYEDPRLLNDRFDYLGGQKLLQLFAELRHEIPPVYMHHTWPEVTVLLQSTIYAANQQEDTPANLLRELEEKVLAIMQRYARIQHVIEGNPAGGEPL